MKFRVVSGVCAVLVIGGFVAARAVAIKDHSPRHQATGARGYSTHLQPPPADPPQSQRPLRVPTKERLRTAFPKNSEQILQQSSQLVLFSVYPMPDFDNTGNLFHDHKILGKKVITDSNQKKALLASLYDGLVPPQSTGLKQIAFGCFMPRHGIRATQNGQVVDLLICFSCRQLKVYLNKKQISHSLITDAPRPMFNGILTQAHIPTSK